MMLDRQHLTIVRQVVRSGGVTAAAEALSLSQSAVSHAMAKLEDYHGVKIWRRKGRGLQLTQAGAYLLALAERMVPELEHAERVLRDMARGRRGALRIGMECHPCEKWLMQVTRPYLAAWPDVDLEIRAAFRFDGVAALHAHEIDVLVTPDPVVRDDLRFTPVFDYALLLAMPNDHPLAARPHISPADLNDQELFTVPIGPDRLDIFTRFLIPAGCRPRRHTGIESIDLILQLVAAGRGVAVLPDWLIHAEAKPLPITARPIGASGLHKSITLGLRVEDAGMDYVEGLIAIAREVRPDRAPSKNR